MYEQPVLFPAVSNRESWVQTIQIADDETGELIQLANPVSGVALYAIYLEISPPRRYGGYDCGEGGYSSAYYGDYGEPCIFASLANYITIPDYGTIQIQIPYTVMQKMRPQKTYRVYLRIEDTPNSDARQILIGELPILHGGRGP